MSKKRLSNEARKRGTSPADSIAIKALTSTGGWVAQSITAHGFNSSPERWDGRSGYEKAISFGLNFLEIMPKELKAKRKKVSDYVEMCTRGLFKKTIAIGYERTGQNQVRKYTEAEALIANDLKIEPNDKFKRLAAISIIDWGKYMTTPSNDKGYTEHLGQLADTQQGFVEEMGNHFGIDKDTQSSLASEARALVHEIWSRQNPLEFQPMYPPSA